MLRKSLGLCSTLKHIRPYTTPSAWSPLKVLADSSVDTLRNEAFTPSVPAILPRGLFLSLPAAQKWFSASEDGESLRVNDPYLADFGDISVPVEITASTGPLATSCSFKRADVPLKLFLAWTKHASTLTTNRFYIAQASLTELEIPKRLIDDLPTPEVVRKAGRGDIYDTNIWMGVPPTYTPLHRDPNPNLFVQLAGRKVVRLLPPAEGREIFESVQRALGRSGSATFREEEMMQGEEKEMLEARIWKEEHMDGSTGEVGYQATLERGDGLFIPKGWWHSIKGVGNGINGSVSKEPCFVAYIHLSYLQVNWWFR